VVVLFPKVAVTLKAFTVGREVKLSSPVQRLASVCQVAHLLTPPDQEALNPPTLASGGEDGGKIRRS
jgi:hypothetical protein